MSLKCCRSIPSLLDLLCYLLNFHSIYANFISLQHLDVSSFPFQIWLFFVCSVLFCFWQSQKLSNNCQKKKKNKIGDHTMDSLLVAIRILKRWKLFRGQYGYYRMAQLTFNQFIGVQLEASIHWNVYIKNYNIQWSFSLYCLIKHLQRRCINFEKQCVQITINLSLYRLWFVLLYRDRSIVHQMRNKEYIFCVYEIWHLRKHFPFHKTVGNQAIF